MRSITSFALSLLGVPRAREAAQKAAILAVEEMPIPAGAPGKDGHSGADGAPGNPGKDGSDGKQGDRGLQGERGPQGDRGLQGIQGVAGDRGPQGIPGSPGQLALGAIQTPGLALGATVDVTMPLSKPMADSSYQVELAMTPPGLIFGGTVTIKSKTTTTIVFTVKATLALGAGTITALAHY